MTGFFFAVQLGTSLAIYKNLMCLLLLPFRSHECYPHTYSA